LKTGRYFGLKYEGRLVGIIGVQRSTALKTKHKALLKELYIDKKMRRLGLAKVFLEEIFTLLKQEKIEQVRLAVRNDNLPAKKLYRILGFCSYGSAPRAIKIGKKYYDDELLIKFL
jgi:ribosomal protein S18 acetylase RimI-like enzyme